MYTYIYTYRCTCKHPLLSIVELYVYVCIYPYLYIHKYIYIYVYIYIKDAENPPLVHQYLNQLNTSFFSICLYTSDSNLDLSDKDP